jgi:hypothetical protein
MLLAGTVVLAAAVTTPVFSQTTGTNAPQAQPPVGASGQPGGADQAPGQPGGADQAPGQPASADQAGDGAQMRGRGGWGMRGSAMMHHDMWHGAMMRWDPQQRCIDRLAWRAARQAYVETKLDLTAEQHPLWDKLQSIAQGEQQKERQLCQSLKPGAAATMLDRMDRAQQFLSARLDALQVAKPAVQALYQALTPEQREIFDHPFRRD